MGCGNSNSVNPIEDHPKVNSEPNQIDKKNENANKSKSKEEYKTVEINKKMKMKINQKKNINKFK